MRGCPPWLAPGAWLLLSVGERCPEADRAIITPISVSHDSLGCRFLTFIPCKGTLDTQLNQNFGGGVNFSRFGDSTGLAHMGAKVLWRSAKFTGWSRFWSLLHCLLLPREGALSVLPGPSGVGETLEFPGAGPTCPSPPPAWRT